MNSVRRGGKTGEEALCVFMTFIFDEVIEMLVVFAVIVDQCLELVCGEL